MPPCRQRNNSTLIKYEGLRKHAEHPNAVCEVFAYQIKPRTMLLEKKKIEKKNQSLFSICNLDYSREPTQHVRCFPDTEDATPALPKKFMVYVVAQDGACFVQVDCNCVSLH